MNLPNKLTVLRMCLVPFILIVGMIPAKDIWHYVTCVICAALFIGASITDMLDGKIARKYNLVTDFGKFMDPLADKLMVFGAMFGILVLNREDPALVAYSVFGMNAAELFTKVFVWCAFIIVFRELAVTSMRMIVSNAEGIVIAANIFGKMKTVSQIIGIVIIIIEPIIWGGLIASYVMLAVMVITTLFSGFSYFKAYWPHINSNK